MKKRSRSRDAAMAKAEESNIRVAVRMRPLSSHEQKNGSCCDILPQEQDLGIDGLAPRRVLRLPCKQRSTNSRRPGIRRPRTPMRRGGGGTPRRQNTPQRQKFKDFKFDFLFGPESTSQNVYDRVVEDIVNDCLRGVNATVMAYGQTSSGKTFTMAGNSEVPGIVPLATNAVFEYIKEQKDKMEFLLRVTMCEVYNEQVHDLINPNNKNLIVLADGVVKDLKDTVVEGPTSIFKLIERGQQNRTSGDTKLNTVSSRSHSIFRLHIESRPVATDPADTVDQDVTASVLTLVDLAGSERSKQTGASGKRFEEGNNINKSLMTLRRVIKGLNKSNMHVPFRDSLLTKILKPSLGGNARTAVICNITPATVFRNDTESTLEFARDVSQITNKLKVNKIHASEAKIGDHAAQVRKLRRALCRTDSDSSPPPTPPRDQTLQSDGTKGTPASSLLHKVAQKIGFGFFFNNTAHKRKNDEDPSEARKRRRMSDPTLYTHTELSRLQQSASSSSSPTRRQSIGTPRGCKSEVLRRRHLPAAAAAAASGVASSGSDEFRLLQVKQLHKSIDDLREQVQRAVAGQSDALRAMEGAEAEAQNKVDFYERQNKQLRGESSEIVGCTEAELREHEKLHTDALVRLANARVERQWRKVEEQLQTQNDLLQEQVTTLQRTKDELQERVGELEAIDTKRRKNLEEVKVENLRLELKLKAQSHVPAKGNLLKKSSAMTTSRVSDTSCDAKENKGKPLIKKCTNNDRTQLGLGSSPRGLRTRQGLRRQKHSIHQLFQEGDRKYNNRDVPS